MQDPLLSYTCQADAKEKSPQSRPTQSHASRKVVAYAFVGLPLLGYILSPSLNTLAESEKTATDLYAAPDSDTPVHLSNLGKWMHEQSILLKDWANPNTTTSYDLVTIVAGNEASDADSIITSITYGYLEDHLNAFTDDEEKAKNTSRVFIPIIKCKRAEMRLRQETLSILSDSGVDPNDLIHMDDAEFYPVMNLVDDEDPTFHVVLVDHNKADGLLKDKVNNRVTEILDHHEDQEAHKAGTEIIAFDGKHGVPLVASACSVVAEQYLQSETGRSLLKKDGGAVAKALLSVVIIDSADMSAASDRDKEVAEKLKADIPNVDSNMHLQFKWLQHKKEDPAFWASATLEENLLYDFKQFEASGYTCGISSTFIGLDTLLEKLKKEDEAPAIEEYIKDPEHPDHDAEKQSTVFMIMLKKAPAMYLAVATKTPGLRDFSEKFLVGPGGHMLSLSKVSNSPNGFLGAFDGIVSAFRSLLGWDHAVGEMDYYNQGNLKASRKQVGPTCQDMLTAFKDSKVATTD